MTKPTRTEMAQLQRWLERPDIRAFFRANPTEAAIFKGMWLDYLKLRGADDPA